jgi:hypothetical protein
MIGIISKENDDNKFVQIIEQIINAEINLTQPKEMCIIKIDSWFDFRWLGFIGKTLGALGMWNNEELRIPPFVPDRVLEQLYFRKTGENYTKQSAPNLHIYQSSGDNITGKRKLVPISESRLFCWYSGNTKNSTQGSLMVYRVGKENQNIWYVSFLKKSNWQIYKTKNTSRAEVKSMIQNDYLALIT